MATVQITIPPALVPRLTTAMRAVFPQYSALDDATCFKKITSDYWRGVLTRYETNQASISAQATAQAATQAAQDTANNDGQGIG